MARWTQNREEARHLLKLQKELRRALANSPYNIIKVVRNDNCCLEGCLSGEEAGNNAHIAMPPTSFYAEVTLQFLNGYTITIDLLDVQTISNVTNREKFQEYYHAGIIQPIASSS